MAARSKHGSTRHLVTMLIATKRTEWPNIRGFTEGLNPRENMDDHSADEGTRMEPEPLSNTTEIKTSDVYKVDKNLPARFNNPEGFRGYRQKMSNPLYQTTNQTYGSKKPTVHEMPTSFSGSRRKFSEHLLRSGMYTDNGFNTAVDKSRLTGPDATTAFHDRINFHYLYHTDGKSQ